MASYISDELRSAASRLAGYLYDLEQSYAALSKKSQDGAVDSALLRGYYLDVSRAMRAVEALGPADGQDNVTRGLLQVTQHCLDLADEAHRKWSGGASVTDRL
jgi:hypothetical protein